MIRKGVSRFSEKIMLNQKSRARWRFNPIPSRSRFADLSKAMLLDYGRTSPPASKTVQICYGCNLMIGRISVACLSASTVLLRASRNVGFARPATARAERRMGAAARSLHKRWKPSRHRPMGPPSARRLIPAPRTRCHTASDTTSGGTIRFSQPSMPKKFSRSFSTTQLWPAADHWQYESSSSVTIRSTLSERMRYRSRPSDSTGMR
jgi:hypothetical protein